MSINHLKALCLLIFGGLLSSCSSHLALREQYLNNYQSGQIEVAHCQLDHAVNKRLPHQKFTESKEAVWMLLDRATIRFSNGHLEGAISDYQRSIEAIEYYQQASSIEKISQFTFSDDQSAYIGEDYEHILAPIYLSLALMQNADFSNALALLRYAEQLQQKKRAHYQTSRYQQHFTLVDNALGKYLFATLLEHKGDFSNARILYQQAASLIQNPCIEHDLRRLDAKKQPQTATVMIVCHNGNVPTKISTTAPCSVASALALETFLDSCGVPAAVSTLTGVPVPILVEKEGSQPLQTTIAIDGESFPLFPFYDVGKTAYFQLEQNKPIIAARAVARLALRRGFVAYANQNNSIGPLVDIGMLLANLATEADVRSWSTLPSRIDVIKLTLPIGQHELRSQIAPSSDVGPFYINLRENDLCVINAFNIHPGNVVFQIPQHFLCIVDSI